MTNNNYINGCISGMCGIILSHPIDSIKTHIQTKNKTLFKFNMSNMYRGIMAPLIGVGLEKALVFGTYNYCHNTLNANITLSGAMAGLVASVIVSPYERIKILRQTNQKVSIKSCISPSFLFKGLTTTFTREVPGFAIYFSTYEALKKYYFTTHNTNISITSSFLFGGISGTMAWLFIYPQDRIKTIIQSSNTNINISKLVVAIYNTGGIRQFYKGFSFAVARAILLHSATFCVFELLTRDKS